MRDPGQGLHPVAEDGIYHAVDDVEEEGSWGRGIPGQGLRPVAEDEIDEAEEEE